jgi:hypothetical protein
MAGFNFRQKIHILEKHGSVDPVRVINLRYASWKKGVTPSPVNLEISGLVPTIGC